jgi:hypothetical protein
MCCTGWHPAAISFSASPAFDPLAIGSVPGTIQLIIVIHASTLQFVKAYDTLNWMGLMLVRPLHAVVLTVVYQFQLFVFCKWFNSWY